MKTPQSRIAHRATLLHVRDLCDGRIRYTFNVHLQAMGWDQAMAATLRRKVGETPAELEHRARQYLARNIKALAHRIARDNKRTRRDLAQVTPSPSILTGGEG